MPKSPSKPLNAMQQQAYLDRMNFMLSELREGHPAKRRWASDTARAQAAMAGGRPRDQRLFKQIYGNMLQHYANAKGLSLEAAKAKLQEARGEAAAKIILAGPSVPSNANEAAKSPAAKTAASEPQQTPPQPKPSAARAAASATPAKPTATQAASQPAAVPSGSTRGVANSSVPVTNSQPGTQAWMKSGTQQADKLAMGVAAVTDAAVSQVDSEAVESLLNQVADEVTLAQQTGQSRYSSLSSADTLSEESSAVDEAVDLAESVGENTARGYGAAVNNMADALEIGAAIQDDEDPELEGQVDEEVRKARDAARLDAEHGPAPATKDALDRELEADQLGDLEDPQEAALAAAEEAESLAEELEEQAKDELEDALHAQEESSPALTEAEKAKEAQFRAEVEKVAESLMKTANSSLNRANKGFKSNAQIGGPLSPKEKAALAVGLTALAAGVSALTGYGVYSATNNSLAAGVGAGIGMAVMLALVAVAVNAYNKSNKPDSQPGVDNVDLALSSSMRLGGNE